MKHVIVGSGPAGVSAALTLRRIAPTDRVTMVAEEGRPLYSKVLTSYFLGGKVSYEGMLLAGAEQLEARGVELLAGRRAAALDPVARELRLSDGERIAYDRLLLATGAAPAVPPVESGGPSGPSSLPGVFTLWTHADAVGLNGWVREGQRAVVVGAGLVGLKAAEALLLRGLSVTVVELLDRVLPQVLGREDAALVLRALEKKGLAVRTRTGVARLAGSDRVERALLADGSALECDVLVMATGVRPNLALAKSAGVAVARGILVDEFLQTNVPGIYAAGDVAEAWDLARSRQHPNPTWGAASEQGRVAAHNMAGLPKPFQGAVAVNAFTFLGFSMAAIGITQPDGDLYRVRSYTDPRTGDYRKLVMLGDRLVGALAIGDVRMAGIWRGLIARRSHDAAVAEALLPRKTDFALSHL